MKTNYVLIDYENVQPKNLASLAEDHFRVKVFVGANQTKVPIELAEAMQALGERAEYIRISGAGSNALDFHIAYYIGRLATSEPKAFFHIISRDTGFDPLIAHLKSKGILANRSATLDGIPILKGLAEASKDDQVDAVVMKLKGMPKSRPQRERTLRAMISAWFGKKLDEPALDRIVGELVRRKFIVLDGVKVTYSLPA
ncbi:PIN domain-containing protein [Thermomonas flagellata]|uniref:PIN domain-containing protein n=1 Tax=Thermomonas flagellata TaxID=2888524 RepID=UPI001F04153E|nr:PIN domain-containing protein [Thermomonas flagellata]